MLLDAELSQLVLVDYQTRLMPAIFEAPQVLANAVRLAQAAQLLQVPVWGTEQNPEKFLELLPEKYAEKFVETYMAKKQGAKIPSIKTKTPPKSEKVSSNLEQFFKRGY